MLGILKESAKRFFLAHKSHLWQRGALILGLTLFALFPSLSLYYFAPYATARVFEKKELSSLVVFAILGFVIDAIGGAFFFGFFTLCFPVIGAFIYSLKHFFILSRESVFGFCFVFNFILASAKMIYIGFFLEGNGLFFGMLFAELLALPLLFAFISMRLYTLQTELLSKKY